MFLSLPPVIWLFLVLPALDMSDWIPSFLWSLLCQKFSESSCLYDPVFLGPCDPEILDVSEFLRVKLPLGPWDTGVTKLLWSCDPGYVRLPGSRDSSGYCGVGCIVYAQDMLGHWLWQTGKEPSHWSGRVPACLVPAGPSYSRFCDICSVFLTSDPMILDVLGHLGAELLLGVVGLASEFAPKVCSGHHPRKLISIL